MKILGKRKLPIVKHQYEDRKTSEIKMRALPYYEKEYWEKTNSLQQLRLTRNPKFEEKKQE